MPVTRRERALRPSLLLTLAMCVSLFSCGGGIFFLSTNDNGVTFLTISGTVSIVQLTTLNNGQITVVTLENNSFAQSLNFCGDVASQFPSGEFVTVTYSKSDGCNKVSQVR